MSTIIPPFLQPGSTIAIAATARSISHEQIAAAIEYMEEKGFKVHLDPGLYEVNHQFAGDETHRAESFNRLLANPEIHAIWCARGGYGTARMVDLIHFDILRENPKWIAGFSDATVLLNHIERQCNMATLHSTMPVFMNAKEGDDYEDVCLALDSLALALQGKFKKFDLRKNTVINPADFEGEIIGGNLSVLHSIIGSESESDWTDKILFIEDIDEYFYHIDRLVLAFKRAGKLKGIKALLVGSFVAMHDHSIPFGYDVKQILEQHCKDYGFPIVFDVDAGHHLRNICLPFGVHAKYKDGILTFATP